MQLTFYLFDKSVKDYDSAIVSSKTLGVDGFREIPLMDNVPFEARAYFQRNKVSRPKWLTFISDYCDLENEAGIRNTTNSFLLLIKVKGRIFALTTGFGFTAINREGLERDFGLRVTLNAIDPEKIKNIDVRNIDLVTRQKRTVLNQDSPVAEFELNLDEDMVSLMGGVPMTERVGKRIFGSDSLSLTSDISFAELKAKCETLLNLSRKRTYQKNFDFIDRVKPVRDKALMAVLDEKLYQAVKARNKDKLTLAYPEMEWEQIERFKISYERRNTEVEDITLQAIYDFLASEAMHELDLSKLKIVGLDSSNNAVTRASSFKDYAVFETATKNEIFILSLRRWFRVEKNYLKRVSADLKGIKEIPSRGFLPKIKPKEGEGEYNSRASRANKRLVLMDKKNFRVPDGQSQIEICDLFSNKREMICVKKETRSATLSHLFSQGSVSATLFNDYLDYRNDFYKRVARKLPKIFDPTQSRNADFTIVYAISSDSSKSLAEALPFFSKVNLRNQRRTIERMGFKLALCKIPCSGV
jgi:uncharacterized protein (TIGR04141 family)